MTGTLTTTLTQKQIDYLFNHQNLWYCVPNCTLTKYITWNYVIICTPRQNAENMIDVLIINDDGTTSTQTQSIASGFWKQMYENTQGSQYTYYKNWGSNQADSYITLGFPEKGTLGYMVSVAQYEYLLKHVSTWHNKSTVVCYMGSAGVVDILTSSNTVSRIAADGTVSSPSWNTTFANRYNGTTAPDFYFILLYSDNGLQVKTDSVETLNIGMAQPLPVKRVDYDCLVRIKDTNWTWANLSSVLTYMTSVEAIPTTPEEKQNLAFQWDSLMAYRFISPYMNNWVQGMISEQNIAMYLESMFKDKWNKLYDAMSSEYNPLAPYHIVETEHTDDVKDESRSIEDSVETSSDGTNEIEIADNKTNKRYGFNSSTEVNAEKDDTSNTNSSEYSDSSNRSQTKTDSFETDNDLDRRLERTGNTGNIFPQQLVDAEWETRKKLVLEEIRKDITNTLTLTIY